MILAATSASLSVNILEIILNFEIRNNNWPVIFNGVNILNLRNKRYHITVHPRENPVLFKKLLNSIANIYPNNVSTRMIENTTKTIRTRSTITIKIKNNSLDFQKIRTFNQHHILRRGN